MLKVLGGIEADVVNEKGLFGPAQKGVAAMKVVLFCGGQGLRMGGAENLPKPMVLVGKRPLLWHVMKYYAHYGHKDFILCLGYGAEAIKNYFINYAEYLSNDFVLSDSARNVELVGSDIHDWAWNALRPIRTTLLIPVPSGSAHGAWKFGA